MSPAQYRAIADNFLFARQCAEHIKDEKAKIQAHNILKNLIHDTALTLDLDLTHRVRFKKLCDPEATNHDPFRSANS